MKNCGDGGAGGSRAGCRGKSGVQGGHPPAGVWGSAPSPVPQHKKQALRAAKGRKKRGLLHPHRFPHPPPPLVSLPSQISAFCALPRAALVFAHAFGSLCHLRWQVPTGHTLPFGPPSGRFALRATAHRADASLTACRFRFCPLNRRGGRWPRPPLVSRSTFGSLCAARTSPQGWRFPPVSQNLCRSTTPQALRAAKGRKKRGSFHPHRFPHPGPQGIIPPAAHLFAPLRQGFAPCAPKPAIKPYQQRSQSP